MQRRLSAGLTSGQPVLRRHRSLRHLRARLPSVSGPRRDDGFSRCHRCQVPGRPHQL